MQVRTGRAGGVSGGPATSTRVGNLLLDGSRGVSQLELRGPLRPRTDVGNRNRGRGGALRGLSPAVVEPGGVRPGVAHQVGGNGEIVPGGEQRRGEAAPEHVRRHLPEPGTSPEHLHPLPDGPGAHSACDHPPPLVHGPEERPVLRPPDRDPGGHGGGASIRPEVGDPLPAAWFRSPPAASNSLRASTGESARPGAAFPRTCLRAASERSSMARSMSPESQAARSAPRIALTLALAVATA